MTFADVFWLVLLTLATCWGVYNGGLLMWVLLLICVPSIAYIVIAIARGET